MSKKLWKIIRTGAGGHETVWSLGYPTRRAAEAASGRLSQTSGGKFHVEAMKGRDYDLLAELEKIQEES